MTQLFDPETRRRHARHRDRGRAVPGRPGEDRRDATATRPSSSRSSRSPSGRSRRRELGHLKKARRRRAPAPGRVPRADASRSSARPSPSRPSSRATRSRSPGIGDRQGLRGHDQAPQLPPRPEVRTARTTSASPARSAPRRRLRACSRACKMAGRMGGKRVTQVGLTVHEVDVEQEPAAGQGRRPGPEERHRRGQRGQGADGRAEGTRCSTPRARPRRTSRSRRRCSASR